MVHQKEIPVNRFLILAAACTFAVAAPAFAADTAPSPAQKAQQDKMAACNTKSEGKTGDDRKKFMSECMSAKPAPAAKPESKMAMCNKQTAGLSGDARSKAQSECMKATPAAPAKSPN
jgi:hypothetical protein